MEDKKRKAGHQSKTGLSICFASCIFGCIPFDQSKSRFCDPKFDFLVPLRTKPVKDCNLSNPLHHLDRSD